MARCPSCGASVSSVTLASGACPYCDAAVRAHDDEFGDRVYDVVDRIGAKVDAVGEAILSEVRSTRQVSPTSNAYLNENDYLPVLRLSDGTEVHAKGDGNVYLFIREPSGEQYEIHPSVLVKALEKETSLDWIGGSVRCSSCASKYHFTRGIEYYLRHATLLSIQCPECTRERAVDAARVRRGYVDEANEKLEAKRPRGLSRSDWEGQRQQYRGDALQQQTWEQKYLAGAQAIADADLEQPLQSMAEIDAWARIMVLARHGSEPVDF